MNKPKIRFKGFEGEWNLPSIEDVFEIRNGYTPSKSVESYWIGGTIPWFRMEDIRASGGFLEDSIQHITPQAVKNNGLFEKGSIIMATTATIGVHAQLIADSLANQRFTNFLIRKSLRERIIAKYVYYAFFGIDEWAIKNTNSGGLLSVNMPLLLKQPFFVPSLPEQRAIASYFTSLDAQIAASSSRLSSLKQIKAASLLNMFPQKGETVPRVRFKGFQGEWKKVKIGDVAPLTGGFAFQSGQFKTSGVPIIRISNILSSGIVGGDFVYYNEFKGDSEFRLYKGDVVIAMSGATTGKVATFEANDFGYQNQRVGKFSRTNLVNYELLSKLVSAPNFQKKIISKLTSSAQPNASSKDIDSIDLVVPEETEEQRVIASYFTTLDAQITLHRERLEKLKQIKAACLEKMFA